MFGQVAGNHEKSDAVDPSKWRVEPKLAVHGERPRAGRRGACAGYGIVCLLRKRGRRCWPREEDAQEDRDSAGAKDRQKTPQGADHQRVPTNSLMASRYSVRCPLRGGPQGMLLDGSGGGFFITT